MKTPIRNSLKFLSLSVLLLMAACGSPKRAATTTTESGTGTQFDDTSSTPLFDTSTVSPTGTPTENLFTTETGTTPTALPAPAQGSAQLPQVTQTEAQCLTDNSSFGLGSYGAASSGTNTSVSCLNSSTYGVDPSLLYQAATTSYKTADYCLGQAASTYAPKPGDSQMDIELSMQMAELSLIRCMRDLVKYQSNLLPWANQQAAAFQHADHNLWYVGQGLQ